MMHIFRRAFFSAVLLACAALARAGVSYDESPVFAFDTRDYTTGLAAESATFAFDTRVVDGLQGAAESVSFTFDTRGATLPPLQITGVLRDSLGVPVVGATIQIKRGGAIFWQGVSGAGGVFTPPSLVGVNYTVIVTKAGYVTSITNITGTSGGNLALSLQSAAMSAPLAAVDVSRTPAATAVRAGPDTSDPAYPILERFDGTQLVYVVRDPITGLDPNLDANRMTVVISHGWVPAEVSDSYATALDWVKQLAILIQNNHAGLAQPPNILVWDWRHKANTLSPQVDDAAEEGIELGKTLQQALGANYSQHVHFIGHSLGTIVNRYACDYVHGSLAYDNPTGRWPVAQTRPHITLLDEAELATVLGQQVITSAVQGWQIAQLQGALLAGSIAVVTDWKYPIPKDAVWVDNYISAVGLQRAAAVNVCLPAEALASGNPITAHSYAHLWYRNSVNPGGLPPAIGYGLSVENTAVFPPTGTGRTAGSLWYENLSTSDPLDLTQAINPKPFEATIGLWEAFAFVGGASVADQTITQPLDALGQSVLNGYDAGIQWAGDVGGATIVKTGQVVTGTSEKVGLWWDAATDTAVNVLDSVNPEALIAKALAAPVSMIRLSKAASPAPQLQTGMTASRQSVAQAASTSEPAYAWVTLKVPADAGLMAFDFTVTGNPSDDRIACAINEKNLFTLPAKLAPVGQTMSTDMMDVSAYAGQTVDIFFGLSGGTSTDCEVAVDGIRFITIPQPKLAIGTAGSNAVFKWPAAAIGWVLEATDSLSATNWQAVPMDTGVTTQSGVITKQMPVAGVSKYYRLATTNAQGVRTVTVPVSFLPPAVTTKVATAVVFNGATLNGTANPRGLVATVHFEYGLTTVYGASTADQNLAAATTAVSVNAVAGNLLPNMVYHYRLVVINSHGTTNGPDKTFKTPKSSNAELSSITASAGLLTPAFSSGTTSYALVVPNATTSITLTPTVADPTANVTVNGTQVASGAASGAIVLAVGVNPVINVLVTAQDGVTKKTYAVTVTRQPDFTGSYGGLAVPVAGATNPAQSVGLGTLTISATGTFTGKFTLGGSAKAVSISGTFDTAGVAGFGAAKAASLNLVRAGLPTVTLVMHLDVQFPLTSQVIGTLTENSVVVAKIALNRRLYTNTASPVSPLMNVPVSILDPATDNGNNTAIFQSLDPTAQGLAATAYPQGDGWALVTVKNTGTVTVVGELADGQAFTRTSFLSKNNVLPFYAPLYSGTGSVSGWIRFRNVAGQSDADGVGLRWFKPANPADTAYVNGWPTGIKVDYLGSKRVLSSISGKTPLGNSPAVSPAVNALLALGDGPLATLLSNRLTVGLLGGTKVDGPPPGGTGASSLTSAFTQDGKFQGVFLFPVTNQSTSFRGVALQKTQRASGYFLATPSGATKQQSGAVTITAQ